MVIATGGVVFDAGGFEYVYVLPAGSRAQDAQSDIGSVLFAVNTGWSGYAGPAVGELVSAAGVVRGIW